ncbi:protein kinase domain-containing protein [Kocuria sp. SL71]|uniref:protein kinase domain-containing protein n=1 Tax=Kocuria sp. SL71 TaxID=2995151 RepID=UPI0022750320|nr:protein kinase [Kocuria sp. SL71]MCY1684987.1 protein kinase [Kocuria sp. SL71]
MEQSPIPELINNRYEVKETIGRGGMATVYKASDRRLGRDVAIKVLKPELARDDSFQERFQREAQAVAGLNHHTITSVYDTGEIPPDVPSDIACPYIVMEYVPGQTLRQLIREDRLSTEDAVNAMEGILDALAYSHRSGIVHRDIKPANVIITPDDRVKVMDFGIARAVEDTQAALTQTQAVLGTAQYLSPEQARGENVDARSDLYSAACVFFEMLTGRAPFVGEASVDIAAQHVRDAPPQPSSLAPQLHPQFDTFMLQALAKPRDSRFQSAEEMRRAVVELREPARIDATTMTRPIAATGAAADGAGEPADGPHTAVTPAAAAGLGAAGGAAAGAAAAGGSSQGQAGQAAPVFTITPSADDPSTASAAGGGGSGFDPMPRAAVAPRPRTGTASAAAPWSG